jgi:predicted alpha-1,2-mannosidase
MIKKLLLKLIVLLVSLNSFVFCQNLTQYVFTTCGTSGKGFTFPGASAPFGMIQWSPDTGPGVRKGGYSYNDTIIYGFSLDHLSGAGCTYAGNFMFTPLLSTSEINSPVNRTAFPTSFSHVNEVAKPGYYAVTLGDSIRVELTAKTRSGFGRFTYPSMGTPTMVINAGSNVRGTTQSNIEIDTLNYSISGSSTGGHFCSGPDITTTYFYAVFNHPFSRYGTWSNDVPLKNGTMGQGVTSGAYVSFNGANSKTILVKAAISYVSTANAKANLDSENPDSSFTSNGFDNVKTSNMNNWNSWLSKIQITGGTTGELQTFYSMMYHTLLAPTVCSDVDGQYMGYDGKIHRTSNGRVQYANFSGWDIYRSESQLLAMIAPKEASDMAQSLLMDYRQSGAFPRWGVPNEDSGIMVGDPAAAIIANFYAFGARNFDAKGALKGLEKAATDPSVKSSRTNIYERPDLTDYLKLGYIPEGGKGGCVSLTLEYASEDFALSQFARALDDKTNSNMFSKRAQNWQNLFNKETGYIQMRRSDGTWAPGFVINSDKYDNYKAYVEGTASQYVWMVPFNLKTLAERMEGVNIAAKRLDAFFTQLNGGFSSEYAYMGNEPSIETPWIYCFLGKPYKTQEVVHQIISELFSSTPDGLPGNDDLGTLSAWYVFASLGIYPEIPGTNLLVLGSPLFPKAVLHLESGELKIIGNGVRKNSFYVHSLTLNGKKWNKPWIKFSDVSSGGRMVYNLRQEPNINWGSNLADIPPSN